MLIEVRWHGRGGQGAVTAARLLAEVFVKMGYWAQASPMFGPERRGAPVVAFTRISDVEYMAREPISNPNMIVVLDPTLPSLVNVEEGVREDAIGVYNCKHDVKCEKIAKVYVVDAKGISLEVLGRPIYNTAMFGATLKVIEQEFGVNIDKKSVEEAILETFPGELGEKNVKAVWKGYEMVRKVR